MKTSFNFNLFVFWVITLLFGLSAANASVTVVNEVPEPSTMFMVVLAVAIMFVCDYLGRRFHRRS